MSLRGSGIIQFGATGSQSPFKYDFRGGHLVQQNLWTNFGNLVARTRRMPGMDGGFNEFAGARPPSEIGQVRWGGVLLASSRDDMQAKRDALNEMLTWGEQVLWYQPYKISTAAADAPRFTWATVNDISMQQDLSGFSDLHQIVQINWQCPVPFWHRPGAGTAWWGGAASDHTLFGTTWGGGRFWANSISAITTIDAPTETVGHNVANGDAPTHPVFSIIIPAGKTASHIRIQRKVNNGVVDELVYNGTLVAGDQLCIRPGKKKVRLNGVNAYNKLDVLNGDWMLFYPGTNTVKYSMSNAGGQFLVGLSYLARYVQ